MAYVKSQPMIPVPPHLRDGHYAGAAKLGHVGYRFRMTIHVARSTRSTRLGSSPVSSIRAMVVAVTRLRPGLPGGNASQNSHSRNMGRGNRMEIEEQGLTFLHANHLSRIKHSPGQWGLDALGPECTDGRFDNNSLVLPM
jgi:hypothetical protein